jgi:pimeloyl-ACP methyl ester carboxylesterase
MSLFILGKKSRMNTHISPDIRISAPSSTYSPRIGGIHRIALVLLSTLGAIAALITALPVMLLFIATSVPLQISIALALVDLAIVIALFGGERPLWVVGAAALGILVVSILAICLSQAYASTPPITDADGYALPNSVASLEKVELGGSEQWITIRSKNTHNPVLLFLAGGPGGSELVWTRKYLADLEDHFVVVNWDQPGSGKSYNAVPIASLTPERIVSDAYALTQLLCQRFQQDKIYLTGESGGTIWGIMLVQQHPELFHAWVSAGGQMVNTTENDIMGYEFALQLAAERGDTATVEALRRNGPPPYVGSDMLLNRYMPYLSVLNGYMYSHAQGDGVEGNRMLDVILGTEYGLVDKVNWFRGLIDTFTVLYPQLEALDFTTQAAELEVPVYFMEGRWDVNAMASLVERYHNLLQAPHNDLIWFEHSGHTPLYEESRRFVDVTVNTVLAQTQPAGAVPVDKVGPVLP